MENKPDDQILDLFLEQTRHRLGDHFKQVILFGSRARGDFEAESDYDCLAIVDEVSPVIDTMLALKGLVINAVMRWM